VVPLGAACSIEAFARGGKALVEGARQTIPTRGTRSGFRSPVAPVAVAINTVFGVAAAWLVARFRVSRGGPLLISFFDVPFSVSPVVAGLALVLIFGRQGLLGPTLAWLDWKVIFAWPGLVLGDHVRHAAARWCAN